MNARVFFAALLLALPALADFEVYFMRHGETPWNRAKVLQGSISFTDITEVGVGMASDTAAEFAKLGISFDRIYTSPYLRAKHTAEIIGTAQKVEVRVDERIRERCCGSCEGVRYGSGEALAAMMEKATGVESVVAVGDRALEFLERELAPLDGGVRRVLCVGHTLLLNVIEARLAGSRKLEKRLLPNCCVHVLAYADGRFSMKERARVFYDPAKYADPSKFRSAAHCGVVDSVKLDLRKAEDGAIVTDQGPAGEKNAAEQAVHLEAALKASAAVPEFRLDFGYFDPEFAERVLAVFAAERIDRSRITLATSSAPAREYFRERHPEIPVR